MGIRWPSPESKHEARALGQVRGHSETGSQAARPWPLQAGRAFCNVGHGKTCGDVDVTEHSQSRCLHTQLHGRLYSCSSRGKRHTKTVAGLLAGGAGPQRLVAQAQFAEFVPEALTELKSPLELATARVVQLCVLLRV